jgi:hypothetical protein
MADQVTRLVTVSGCGGVAGKTREVSDPRSNDLDSGKLEEAYGRVVALMRRRQTNSLEELQGAVEYLLDAIVTQRRSKRGLVKNSPAKFADSNTR